MSALDRAAREQSRLDTLAERMADGPAWPGPEPLPEGLPAVPALDPVLLPDALRPWIEDIAERMQCPLDFPAVGAMVALAAVVGTADRDTPTRARRWRS